MPTPASRAREIQLLRRPIGLPRREDFALVEVDLPELAAGELQVKNLYISVDPYMRPRMDLGDSYVAPFALNEALEGMAIGVVVASKHDAWQVGDLLSSFNGWRDYFNVEGDLAHTVPGADDSDFDIMRATLTRLPHTSLSPACYLGVLGPVGLTAYVGLKGVGEMRGGETVFVSGAAGGVGHLAGQVAKLHGCRVIGSVGSQEKCEFLLDKCGFDAAFNYRDAELVKEIATAAPEGVDVFFDNVGGDILAAGLSNMRVGGRVVVCGMIADYNTEGEQGPVLKNYFQVVARELTIKGFVASSYIKAFPQWISDMEAWLESGDIHFEQTVYQGLENCVDAFLGLFMGKNTGKAIVRLDD